MSENEVEVVDVNTAQEPPSEAPSDPMAPVAALFGATETVEAKPRTAASARSKSSASTTAAASAAAAADEAVESIFKSDALVLKESPSSRRRYNARAVLAGVTFFFTVAPRDVLSSFMRRANQIDRKSVASASTAQAVDAGEEADIEAKILEEQDVLDDLEALHDDVISRCVTDWDATVDGRRVPCTPQNLSDMAMPIKSDLVDEIISKSKLGRSANSFLR